MSKKLDEYIKKQNNRQVLLYYAWEEGESGIFHAFNAADPASSVDEKEKDALYEQLGITEDSSSSYNWNCMYINLPESLIQRIKAEGVEEYKNLQEVQTC